MSTKTIHVIRFVSEDPGVEVSGYEWRYSQDAIFDWLKENIPNLNAVEMSYDYFIMELDIDVQPEEIDLDAKHITRQWSMFADKDAEKPMAVVSFATNGKPESIDKITKMFGSIFVAPDLSQECTVTER